MSVKISVIIPVYNTEKYIAKCLDSIINQDYENYEVIIVGGCSTDSSDSICSKYVNKKVKLILEEVNKGTGVARKTGFEQSTGDYIWFVDSDDYLEPGVFSRMNEILAVFQYDIIQFGCRVVDEKGRELKLEKRDEEEFYEGGLLEYFLSRKNVTIVPWDKVFSRNLLKKITFPSTRCSEDIWMNTLIFSEATSLKCISDVCYNYLIRKTSMTRSFSPYRLERIKLFDFMYGFVKVRVPSWCQNIAWYAKTNLVKEYCITSFSKADNKKEMLRQYKDAFDRFDKLEPVINENISIKRRIMIGLFKFSPALCACSYWLAQLIIKIFHGTT